MKIRFLRFCSALLAGMFLACLPSMVFAKDREIRDARLWTAPDHTRLVFDLSGPVKYRVFRLKSPERVVVDMKNAKMKAKLERLTLPDPVIREVRYGRPGRKIMRVVIDVKEQVQARSFLLKPMHGKPYRLVVDLLRPQLHKPQVVTAEKASARREIVIAVDAGHGGEDPGAIGRGGLKEKDVTLAVAIELARIINARRGMRAVLIRRGDYFISLRKRVKLAIKAKADLMVSIHADAVKDRRVAGASVYTLSEKGASDRVAAMLAAKENAADVIGGATPDEVDDPVVNRILADLTKRDSLNSAQVLAEEILKRLGHVGPIKYTQPKRARFVVLGATRIPSVLVELDYISNPRRERMLRNKRHLRRLASALVVASEHFLRRQGRLVAARPSVHTVSAGESLWVIAKRYGVSISSLRAANGLGRSQGLRIGQQLRLPRL